MLFLLYKYLLKSSLLNVAILPFAPDGSPDGSPDGDLGCSSTAS